MIEKPPVLTLRSDWPRPTDEQIAAFRDVPASMVSDAMDGRGALDISIARVLNAALVPTHVAGPALTADNGPGGITATLAALECARAGDVVMISVSGFQGAAAFGDRVAGMLRNAGVVGMITDGPVRDADGIEQTGMPVWATGLIPTTPHDNGPARTGLPMMMAGQQIAPGDMVIADRDGVVIVPFDDIDRVIARLAEVQALEAGLDAEVAKGLVLPEGIREFLASDAVKRV